MNFNKISITGCTFLLLLGAAQTQANTVQFNLDNAADGGGDPVDVGITLEELANSITADVSVINQPPTGDLRGVFFNVVDGTGLTLGDITGGDITDRDADVGSGGGLGGGANTGPNGDFDFGLEIGTPGIGGDDIQSTTISFDTSGNSLTLGSFEDFLVRLTSVGPVGNRGGSSRVVGTPPQPPTGVPAPGTLLLLALGLLGLAVIRAGAWRAPRRNGPLPMAA